MRRVTSCHFLLFCSLVTWGFAANCLVSAQDPTDAKLELSQLLPEGEVELEFLDVALSERGTELANRFLHDTDRQWLRSYIAKVAQPGQALPYHPNFGLSEEEYAEYLVAAKKMKFKPIGIKWKCLIQQKDRLLSFKPIGHRSAQLSSIRVHIDSSEAEASGVQLGRGEWRSHTEEGPAIGPWRGFTWRKETGSEAELLSGGDFQIVKLDILHLIGTEYVLVNQKIAEQNTGHQPTSREFMLRYRVPGLK
tara:strand:+ start:224 stop:973 length:750 start_codon:yes stop_codon:yes gene_type:complete